jgi:hypothetical protein
MKSRPGRHYLPSFGRTRNISPSSSKKLTGCGGGQRPVARSCRRPMIRTIPTAAVGSQPYLDIPCFRSLLFLHFRIPHPVRCPRVELTASRCPSAQWTCIITSARFSRRCDFASHPSHGSKETNMLIIRILSNARAVRYPRRENHPSLKNKPRTPRGIPPAPIPEC